MSTLKADTIQSTSGGAATLTKQRATKVWAISNAGAAAPASFNLTSITDNGTGDYTFTIASAMDSANYAHPIGTSLVDGGAGLGVSITSKAAGSLRIGTIRDDSTKTDCTYISLSILGDLA